MKIYLGRNYTNDAFLNLKDCGGIAFDTEIVNVEGLVSMLELHIGLHPDVQDQIDRQAEWLKCLRPFMVNANQKLAEAYQKNRLGVSNELLSWRDHLKMAGWSREMKQPSNRFQIIALADAEFGLPSVGDRIQALMQCLNENPFSEPTEIIVGESTEKALQPLVSKLLEKLSQNGATVKFTPDEILAKKHTNLARVQQLLVGQPCNEELKADDNSFQIWNFDTAVDACRYVALLPKDEFDVYVVCQGKLLDNTQRMLNQPTSGTAIANDSPQIVQMFMLGMNLFEYPLNVRNLLDWLQLPMHPIDWKLRQDLVNAIVKSGGYDNEDYKKAIDEYFESIKEDKDKSEKVRISLATFDVRPDAEVNIEKLRHFNNALWSWASQRSAFESLEEAKRAQFATVANLCLTLDQLIRDIAEPTIPYSRLEAAISTLYNGADSTIYKVEAGSRHMAFCSEILTPADAVIWTDCYNYEPEKYPYSFLNSTERKELEAQGCHFQTENDFNQAEIHALREPVLRCRKRCVIVTANSMGATDTNQHPLVTRIMEAFNSTSSCVVRKPLLDEFETYSRHKINNANSEIMIKVESELKMNDHESYSSLDTLIQYPIDYVLDKVAQIHNISTADLKKVYTTKGDVAHKAIETLFDGNGPQIVKNIKDNYDKEIERIIREKGALLLLPENKLEAKNFVSELRECLEALAEIITENDLTVDQREGKVETKIGLLEGEEDKPFIGYIDMVLKDKDGNLVIFDFKWTNSRHYHHDLLEKNLSLQLALYREMMSHIKGAKVVATAYFTMPNHRLYTTSQALHGSNVEVVTPDNNNDLVEEAINSYRFRRQQFEQKAIEFGEGVKIDFLDYGKAQEENDLFPLAQDYDNKEDHASNRFSNYTCFKPNQLQ